MKLAENFPPLLLANVTEVNSRVPGSGFSFQTITEDFIISAIKRLKPNKAVGLDKISVRLLKDSVDIIAPSLTDEFLPFYLEKKQGLYIPLHKNGDKQNPSNYRPISILSTLSKILERAVHIQFYAYLTENNLISPNQFGFRSESSTVTAAARFTDQILLDMDNSTVTGVVFLDLPKAFDTVNHSILLRKLSNIGVDDMTLDWFDSFLSNRSQVTCCGNVQSNPNLISIGVAQGSILGPLLFFNLYG